MTDSAPIDRAALAASFATTGEAYDRHRPGFPTAAVDLFLTGAERNALDLGAGTGKLTERLVGRVPEVVAVDPAESMLDVLRRKLPTVVTHVATAEAIPVADASQDVVTAAQAFHWFDRDRALVEIGRVLRPGGTLALLWNAPDPTCTWDIAAHAIAHPDNTRDPEAEELDEPEPLELPGFTAVTSAYVPWHDTVTRADYLARWATVSSFLAATEDVRTTMLAGVTEILDAHPATRGRDTLDLPMRTLVHTYRR